MKVYTETIELKYSAHDLFKVVSNVDDYKLFIPFCVGSKVFPETRNVSSVPNDLLELPGVDSVNSETFTAELRVGFKGLNERYNSTVTTREFYKVTATSNNTKIFKTLKTVWSFIPNSLLNKETSSKQSQPISLQKDFEKSDNLAEIKGFKLDAAESKVLTIDNERLDSDKQEVRSYIPANPVMGRPNPRFAKDLGQQESDPSENNILEIANSKLNSNSVWENGSTTVKFEIEFEFNSFLYSYFSNIFFDQVCKQMIAAFIRRCQLLYDSK
ncbi:Coenzyme Q-binding protein COQ10-like protein [Smittium mucronatum]|uniref:Coenzyme Q-binding protein COQ10-like protein n=1 Tax=Smittium mucronatum TaxID=133383 RepID=A0A1R0GPU3_9FUNG|nr:Coenzyme Q-binding protein COQ10-like protein [Smittium mucronatum]